MRRQSSTALPLPADIDETAAQTLLRVFGSLQGTKSVSWTMKNKKKEKMMMMMMMKTNVGQLVYSRNCCSSSSSAAAKRWWGSGGIDLRTLSEQSDHQPTCCQNRAPRGKIYLFYFYSIFSRRVSFVTISVVSMWRRRRVLSVWLEGCCISWFFHETLSK